ncbi:MAG: hypothetical protein IH968_17745 [Gemmatimonadetes bacterium]|nr:hypothetical protein [Gemmatimonadota bacterium]
METTRDRWATGPHTTTSDERTPAGRIVVYSRDHERLQDLLDLLAPGKPEVASSRSAFTQLLRNDGIAIILLEDLGSRDLEWCVSLAASAMRPVFLVAPFDRQPDAWTSASAEDG